MVKARVKRVRLEEANKLRALASSRRGRGAFYLHGSHTVRSGGADRRENAGMSSESKARNFAAESPRFPGEGQSTQGKSGPKPRTKVVGDGQLVDIPVPSVSA
jgi:hypothetical protein